MTQSCQNVVRVRRRVQYDSGIGLRMKTGLMKLHNFPKTSETVETSGQCNLIIIEEGMENVVGWNNQGEYLASWVQPSG